MASFMFLTAQEAKSYRQRWTIRLKLKLYNDQPNAQVFNLFIYLLLPYMFRAFC
jgi:hypothetical protein